MKKSKKSIVLLLLLFFTFSGCIFSINKDKGKNSDDSGAVREENDTKNNMGINLWFISSWSKAYTFVDVMKEAGGNWLKVNALYGETVEVDEFGYPKTDAQKLIFESTPNIIGTYSLYFKGKAEKIEILGITGAVREIEYNQEKNITTAKVDIKQNNGNGLLQLRGTRRTPDAGPETGVTDIHLYRPGYPADGSVTFTNELLAAVKKFQVIRFMEWSEINRNPSQTWEERNLPEYSAQNRVLTNSNVTSSEQGCKRGVSYEYMIQLCNEANCDLWVNIPVNADDQYIANLAKLIHYGRKGSDGKDYPPLKSNLKVYVEYGNEIWNTGFYNWRWIDRLWKVALTDSTHPIFFDGNKNYYVGMYRYVGWRTVGMSNIFRTEFGDNQMMTRIRPVLEGQLANKIWMTYALEFIEKYYATPRDGMSAKEVSYFIYGGGGSAYYGINIDKTKYSDAEYLMAHHFDEGMYPDKTWLAQTKEDSILMKNYGLKKIAYEGGPGVDYYDTVNKKSTLTIDQQRAVNANPKMKDMIIKCQDAWSEVDGDLLAYYCLGAGASWEFTTSLLLDSNGKVYSLETPKMLGIDELNKREKAPLNFGVSIDKEIVISETEMETRLGKDTTGYVPSLGVSVLGGEDIFGLALNVKKAGKYKMMMKGRVHGDPVVDSKKGSSEVRLNGKLLGNIIFQVNGAGTAKAIIENSSEIEMDIPKGFSVVRVTNFNRMALYSLTFTEVTEDIRTKKR